MRFETVEEERCPLLEKVAEEWVRKALRIIHTPVVTPVAAGCWQPVEVPREVNVPQIRIRLDGASQRLKPLPS